MIISVHIAIFARIAEKEAAGVIIAMPAVNASWFATAERDAVTVL